MTPLHQELDAQARKSARRFLVSESELLGVIQLIDENRVFESWGFTSLIAYCVGRLNLSYSSAYGFMAVARKAKEVPLLKEAVAEGKLNVSQARRIVSVLKPDNALQWIETAAIEKQKDLE